MTPFAEKVRTFSQAFLLTGLLCCSSTNAQNGEPGPSQDEELRLRIAYAMQTKDERALVGLLEQTSTSDDMSPSDALTLMAIRYEIYDWLVRESTDRQKNTYFDAYEKTYSEFVSSIKEETRQLVVHGSEAAVLRNLAELQKLHIRHGTTLNAVGSYDRALESFNEAIRCVSGQMDAFDRAGGGTLNGSDVRKPYREWFGVTDENELLRLCISAASNRYAKEQSDASQQSLLDYYGRFMAKYATDPYAGLFARRQMNLTNSFDLDALCRVFRGITNKDHPQFIYSYLGLAHDLVMARRFEEALEVLNYIKEKGISQDRLAELYWALGETHMGLKHYKEALECFFVVRQLSDQYKTVEMRIQQIIGINKNILEDIISASLMPPEGSGTGTPELSLKGGEVTGGSDRASERDSGIDEGKPTESSSNQVIVSTRGRKYPFVAAIAAVCVTLGLLIIRTRAAKYRVQHK
jgi:tetratricopeptide (TPR) repeat protein